MAVPMTLAEGRTTAGQLLDDPNARRWSTTQIDFALSSSMSRCQSDYVAEGGERFDLETTLTSSAVDGSVDTSTVKPMNVKAVMIVVDNVRTPVYAARRRDMGIPDTEARSIQVVYVPELALGGSVGVPMVGGAAVTDLRTWAAFDHWVVARAALQLATKDANLAQSIRALEQDARESCLKRVGIPQALEWPRPGSQWPMVGLVGLLRWTWMPSTGKIMLVRGRW